MELQKRFSISFSPFAFGLAGLALRLYVRLWRGWLALLISTASFHAFIMALTIIATLCLRGYLPSVAMWLPEIVALAVAVTALLFWVSKTPPGS